MIFARFRPPQPPVVIYSRKSGGWEAESFVVAEVVGKSPPTQSSLCTRAAMLRISAPCAQSLLFPKGKETLYQIFINTSVFSSKSQNSPQRQKTFRLWRKDFCPSGSRCFDEYLDYFQNSDPPKQSQSGGFIPSGFCIAFCVTVCNPLDFDCY